MELREVSNRRRRVSRPARRAARTSPPKEPTARWSTVRAPRAYLQADMAFHECLLRATHNQFIAGWRLFLGATARLVPALGVSPRVPAPRCRRIAGCSTP
jgi:DNA-binding FadR family transcriptional regulator